MSREDNSGKIAFKLQVPELECFLIEVGKEEEEDGMVKELLREMEGRGGRGVMERIKGECRVCRPLLEF